MSLPGKPMNEAPLAAIEALHFERGWLVLRPCHEATYWLPERHWHTDDEEEGCIPESDFECWRESAAMIAARPKEG